MHQVVVWMTRLLGQKCWTVCIFNVFTQWVQSLLCVYWWDIALHTVLHNVEFYMYSREKGLGKEEVTKSQTQPFSIRILNWGSHSKIEVKLENDKDCRVAASPALWLRARFYFHIQCRCNPSEPPSVPCHTAIHPLVKTPTSLSHTKTPHTHTQNPGILGFSVILCNIVWYCLQLFMGTLWLLVSLRSKIFPVLLLL